MGEQIFAPAQPHGRFVELFPDVFMVTGRYAAAPLVSFTRNMIVLRWRGELTLINAVRLSRVGERDLEALGQVKHLVRLGAFHALDDPYYMATFRPAFWVSGRQRELRGLCPDFDLDRSDLELPLPSLRTFHFRRTRHPESALWLGSVEGGLLVTCDAIQNVVETRGMSLGAKVLVRALGLRRRCGVAGRSWRRAMARDDDPTGATLLEDFDRLLAEHRFEHLVSAHGPLQHGRAHARVAQSVTATFGSRALVPIRGFSGDRQRFSR